MIPALPVKSHSGPDILDALRAFAEEHGLALTGLKLFYYEAHELQYDNGVWVPWGADAPLDTNVQVPSAPTPEGFDVASFDSGLAPECSPLSCNGLAEELAVNSHCLFPTFEAAVRALDEGRFEHSEPGPLRVVGVHSVLDA